MKAIMYHYVRRSVDGYPYFYYLDVDNFERQLDYFEQQYGFLSRQQFFDAITNGNPQDGVVLTFDDGLKDHYRYVLPVLKSRKIWGIFYVSSRPYTDNKTLDVHRIHLLLGRIKLTDLFEKLESYLTNDMIVAEHRQVFERCTYRNQDNPPDVTLFKRLFNYYISYQFRSQILDQLFSHFIGCETDWVAQHYMSTDELKKMHKEGMIIGNHTVNHPVLSRLTYQRQYREISDCFDFLMQALGSNIVKTFCYPYGGFHSFNSDSEKILMDLGCQFSFNVEAKDIDADSLSNRRQALSRYDCNQFDHGQASKG